MLLFLFLALSFMVAFYCLVFAALLVLYYIYSTVSCTIITINFLSKCLSKCYLVVHKQKRTLVLSVFFGNFQYLFTTNLGIFSLTKYLLSSYLPQVRFK